ncbi:type II toxin-antitoxin system VapB family antitoxin [Streptacidiphilus sp. N1-10]|uniref:Type II toxin-antitoxin system VapB family antitoxin n=1 Tax=Streptacidiphilus jeojiensis TaxID=3229225 RepID=A0ABV6XWJ2_9ACTN
MSKILMELDDEMLAEAAARFGTTTKVATVRAALREAVKYQRRQEFFDAMDRGEFDFSDIIAASGPRDEQGNLIKGAPGKETVG